MRTPVARALHLALFLLGVVLYVVFVLPRWWVLTGDIPSTLATAGRIAAGIPIAAAAWPVWQILQTALRSKTHTPEIALRLRAWSAVLHVVAGVLILLAAIVEIWLRLEVGGPYLFAVYGAAGAIAILAFLGLYLSFVAEKPPAAPKAPKAPKPAKAKKAKPEKKKAEKTPRGKKRAAKSEETAEIHAESEAAPEAEAAADTAASETEPAADPAATAAETETTATVDEEEGGLPESGEAPEGPSDTGAAAVDKTSAEPAAQSPSPVSSLRNKRPAGKSGRRLRR